MSRAAVVMVTGWPCAASQSPTVAQVGGIGAVDGDHQRLAGGDHVGGQAVEEAAVPQPQRLEADLQQPLLARPALAVRGEHAAGHPGRAAVVGCGAPAPTSRPARRGGPPPGR